MAEQNSKSPRGAVISPSGMKHESEEASGEICPEVTGATSSCSLAERPSNHAQEQRLETPIF